MRRAFLIPLLCLMLLPLLSPAALAEEAYAGYTTSAWGDPVPAPAGYRVRAVVDGPMMGAGRLSEPQDLFYDKIRGELWVADTGNARVLVLDRQLRLLREYSAAGEAAFVTPTGVFVRDKGLVYIADEGAGAVLCMDAAGALQRKYERPVSELYEDTTPFKPQKVVVDSAGRVYVLSSGVYQGLLCYYEDGSFLNYFGASHVDVTAKVLLQKLWRAVMTREQRSATESFVPIEYANITIDEEDMIYAVVTVSETAGARSLVKLNPMGINILPPVSFSGQVALVDALPEMNSLYTALDRITRRVVQLGVDTRGVVLNFGGWGDQDGLFKDPVSMAAVDDEILVLDRETGAISVFAPTAFGRAIHDATALYGQGLYIQSIPPWQEVLRLDSNYAMAYRGLGKAYYQLEDYELAMANFRLANDKQGYSDAQKELSLILVRRHMGLIFGSVAAFSLLLSLIGRARKKRRKPLEASAGRFLRPLRLPWHLMAHPYDGFDAVKDAGAGSVKVGAGIVGLLFLASIISYVGTGFAFNYNRLEKLNVFLLLAGTAGTFLLAYIANLAVSSLMDDCEGRARELFIVLSHALLPAILAQLAAALFSNFVNLEMQVFLQMLQSLGLLWSLTLLGVGQYQINRLTVKRTLLNLLLSVLVMLVILVLMVLLYSLIQQISVFFTTLYNEIMFRV
ncbi:MAG: YIP1 family protein [Christensenellales bacterium]